jgi:PRC-barrel domain
MRLATSLVDDRQSAGIPAQKGQGGCPNADRLASLRRFDPAGFCWNPPMGGHVVLHHQPVGRTAMMTDVITKPHRLIASDRVEGTAVRRPNGDRLGHIERLMIDKVSGQVSYAILSFGGFLGIGTSLLPLPWVRLSYNPRFEAYELDIDDEELRRAPSFRADQDFDWGDRSQEAELHRYYGVPPYWAGF